MKIFYFAILAFMTTQPGDAFASNTSYSYSFHCELTGMTYESDLQVPQSFQVQVSYNGRTLSGKLDGQTLKPYKNRYDMMVAKNGLVYQVDWEGAAAPWLAQIYDPRVPMMSKARYSCLRL